MADKKGLWIPQSILERTDLSAVDKCIFCDIVGLAVRSEGCTAKNAYFASLIGISIPTASRSIKKLFETGLIEIVEDRTGFGVKRTISIPSHYDTVVHIKMIRPSYQNEQTTNQNDSSYKGKINKDINKKINKPLESKDFDLFYSNYPKKRKRPDALKAYQSAEDLPDVQFLIDRVNAWKLTEDWTKDNGKFIPYPATWLRGQGWLDDLPAAKESDEDRFMRMWKEA